MPNICSIHHGDYKTLLFFQQNMHIPGNTYTKTKRKNVSYSIIFLKLFKRFPLSNCTPKSTSTNLKFILIKWLFSLCTSFYPSNWLIYLIYMWTANSVLLQDTYLQNQYFFLTKQSIALFPVEKVNRVQTGTHFLYHSDSTVNAEYLHFFFQTDMLSSFNIEW